VRERIIWRAEEEKRVKQSPGLWTVREIQGCNAWIVLCTMNKIHTSILTFFVIIWFYYWYFALGFVFLPTFTAQTKQLFALTEEPFTCTLAACFKHLQNI